MKINLELKKINFEKEAEFKTFKEDNHNHCEIITAQKMKFSIKDFFGKCDQIRRKTSFFVKLILSQLKKSKS